MTGDALIADGIEAQVGLRLMACSAIFDSVDTGEGKPHALV